MRDPINTTAVVLVAGRGSRLSGVNPGRPKCLVEVNGVSIIERLLAALEVSKTGAAVLVVGYEHEAIKEVIRVRRPAIPIRFVLNPGYLSSGTARSLQLGLSAVEPGGDVAFIEGDVIFDPAVLSGVISVTGTAATALAHWGADHSGSCAVVEHGFVTRWLHESRRPHGFSPYQHSKTVNVTWLEGKVWKDGLLPALDKTLREDGETAPVEYAFDRLVMNAAHRVHAMHVDSLKWWEVDTPEDLRIASGLFE